MSGTRLQSSKMKKEREAAAKDEAANSPIAKRSRLTAEDTKPHCSSASTKKNPVSAIVETDSKPGTSALTYNYWKKERKAEKSQGFLQIKNLKVGESTHALKFRVTSKYLWDGRRGPALKFHGYDGNEVTILAFSETAIQFSQKFEINNVYRLENFLVEEEKEQYRSNTRNGLQIVLSEASILTKIEDAEMPKIPFNFKSIRDVKELPVGSTIDVIGIVCKDWGVETVGSAGKRKRDINITDETKENIVVTMWEDKAINFNSTTFGLVTIRNGSLTEYRGIKSITVGYTTNIWEKPNIEEAELLMTWFDENRLDDSP